MVISLLFSSKPVPSCKNVMACLTAEGIPSQACTVVGAETPLDEPHPAKCNRSRLPRNKVLVKPEVRTSEFDSVNPSRQLVAQLVGSSGATVV